jgi:hypothetical protein
MSSSKVQLVISLVTAIVVQILITTLLSCEGNDESSKSSLSLHICWKMARHKVNSTKWMKNSDFV